MGMPLHPGISGLVVEYIVAIDVTRVRFPADACPVHIYSLSFIYILYLLHLKKHGLIIIITVVFIIDIIMAFMGLRFRSSQGNGILEILKHRKDTLEDKNTFLEIVLPGAVARNVFVALYCIFLWLL